MSTDLLWMGEGYVKTNGLLGPSWVLRHLSLSPHHLEWHSDQSRSMIVGTVQLAGGSLLLTESHEAPTIPEGTFGLCMELDWSGRDFLPMFFTSPQEAHDAVLVSALFLHAQPLPPENLHIQPAPALDPELHFFSRLAFCLSLSFRASPLTHPPPHRQHPTHTRTLFCS
jgi:hypothetical protein